MKFVNELEVNRTLFEFEQEAHTAGTRRGEVNRKSELGQFMTPPSIAHFMASMFPSAPLPRCQLLDAGAGAGSLSCAFLDRWANKGFDFQDLELTAFEIDAEIGTDLEGALRTYASRLPFRSKIVISDFIEEATGLGQFQHRGFTHAVLNPPYKKINRNSRYRHRLRRSGIETVNLYTAFVALAIKLMAPRGVLVAIIPRSFCNGPYYRPFREFLFSECAIHRIHLFESRNQAFKDDGVLQENVIVMLERKGRQEEVVISSSTDDSFSDLQLRSHPFEEIVCTADAEKFIHIPHRAAIRTLNHFPSVKFSLEQIGIAVSTGPVVDFRLRRYLRDQPGQDCVPLLYPGHFRADGINWPIVGRKPNSIVKNSETEKWLLPSGFYCSVHRFTSKEQPRRVIANVIDPACFGDAAMIGFENHLNVFHEHKHGLSEDLARGLAVYLNSTAVDESFRRFNGHTQVNATDLRSIKYPARETLVELGRWAKGKGRLLQTVIDEQLEQCLS